MTEWLPAPSKEQGHICSLAVFTIPYICLLENFGLDYVFPSYENTALTLSLFKIIGDPIFTAHLTHKVTSNVTLKIKYANM